MTKRAPMQHKVTSQKFHRGDVVRIAKDLGMTMRHFPADRLAVVVGSYRDQFGGGAHNSKDYTLRLEGNTGGTSWYHEDQLTLVEASPLGDFNQRCEDMFSKHKL